MQVYHGAIVHWFHEIHRRPPGNFDHDWSDFVKGAKKDKVRKIHTGESTRGGADKLDFMQYASLADAAVRSNHYGIPLVLVLAWNLMTIVSNISQVKYEHVSVSGDHIVIDINRHKGGPEGKSLE